MSIEDGRPDSLAFQGGGQALECAGVWLADPRFTHGRLYVAALRTDRSSRIRSALNTDGIIGYREVLSYAAGEEAVAVARDAASARLPLVAATSGAPRDVRALPLARTSTDAPLGEALLTRGRAVALVAGFLPRAALDYRPQPGDVHGRGIVRCSSADMSKGASTEMFAVTASTWCHQQGGMYSTSPASSTHVNAVVCATFA